MGISWWMIPLPGFTTDELWGPKCSEGGRERPYDYFPANVTVDLTAKGAKVRSSKTFTWLQISEPPGGRQEQSWDQHCTSNVRWDGIRARRGQ